MKHSNINPYLSFLRLSKRNDDLVVMRTAEGTVSSLVSYNVRGTSPLTCFALRGGRAPIWSRRGCSSEILNLTPKGKHLAVA